MSIETNEQNSLNRYSIFLGSGIEKIIIASHFKETEEGVMFYNDKIEKGYVPYISLEFIEMTKQGKDES